MMFIVGIIVALSVFYVLLRLEEILNDVERIR